MLFARIQSTVLLRAPPLHVQKTAQSRHASAACSTSSLPTPPHHHLSTSTPHRALSLSFRVRGPSPRVGPSLNPRVPCVVVGRCGSPPSSASPAGRGGIIADIGRVLRGERGDIGRPAATSPMPPVSSAFAVYRGLVSLFHAGRTTGRADWMRVGGREFANISGAIPLGSASSSRACTAPTRSCSRPTARAAHAPSAGTSRA